MKNDEVLFKNPPQSPFFKGGSDDASPFFTEGSDDASPFFKRGSNDASPFFKGGSDDAPPFFKRGSDDASPFFKGGSNATLKKSSPFEKGGLRGIYSKHNGFTLIEILIALFIFSIIAMIVTGGLHSVLETQKRIEKKAAQLAEIQFALLLFSRDIEQTVDRPVISKTSDLTGFVGTTTSVDFTHAGLANPDNQLRRPTLQRTEYTFTDHQFIRTTWPLPDQTAQSTPQQRLLLKDVEDVTFSWLDQQNHFHNSWPVTNQPDGHLPRAVRISLTLNNWGKITQLYIIPGQPFAKTH
ncbi:MAG: type II secretion system minor pseudopilin GspJ [Gammaproteobacteria bacterium]|nr:type II secretion system minor pseudopilin GspJ [Gammaproteobacteria bacterium]